MLVAIRNKYSDKIQTSVEADSLKLGLVLAVKNGANLCGANLCGADLCEADLHGASLCGANLYWANLHRANLHRANLHGADLCEADLRAADLRAADLHGADLSRADLYGADLGGANLYGAKLCGADLTETKGLYSIVPETGSFEGYKKLKNTTICRLLIPAQAARVGGYTGRKCRAEFAKVLEGSGTSLTTNYTPVCYTVGKIVHPDTWDPDPRVECSAGIHFFLTRKEAEEYS